MKCDSGPGPSFSQDSSQPTSGSQTSIASPSADIIDSNSRKESEARSQASSDEEDAYPTNTEALELGPLSARSLAALRRLARFGRQQQVRGGNTLQSGNASSYNPEADVDFHDGWKGWPANKRAAVMVALFGGRSGELNVLLSTRAANMRIHWCGIIFGSKPGQVALPGGKMDASDLDPEYTARREAFEEIGLPMSKTSVRHLCNLPPFLSLSSTLLVTPVVCFLLDPTQKPVLNPSEVSNVFSHPLFAFLSDRPPSAHYVPADVFDGSKPYRTHYDIKWTPNELYRMSKFEGRLAPIWGFTADILLHTAILAYNQEPEFERRAPGQKKRLELIKLSLKGFQQDKEWLEGRRSKAKAQGDRAKL